MNPIDVVLAFVQFGVALLLLFRVNTLPDFAIYILVASLVISGIMDIFDM